MTLPHPEAVADRKAVLQQVARHAQQAWRDDGEQALNPYTGGDLFVAWEAAFARAQASDELEGSAA